jgi:hypothetical protein
MPMSQHFEDMVLVLEEAAILREERITGDPNREVDETTLDDVVYAMLLHPELVSPADIPRYQKLWTKALRLMLKGKVDPQG